jgi:hypothetical protein
MVRYRSLADRLRDRFPSLSTATAYKIVRAVNAWEYPDDLVSVYALTDDELLSCRGFGRVALVEWRSAWPAPVPDSWREHAEMIAGVR